ncbi:hypothetical protein HOG98_01445 [bacterium]|nr:hypothetical protein [bacterium]
MFNFLYKIVSLNEIGLELPEFLETIKPKLNTSDPEPIVSNLETSLDAIIPFLTNAKSSSDLDNVTERVVQVIQKTQKNLRVRNESSDYFTREKIGQYVTSKSKNSAIDFSIAVIELFDTSIISEVFKNELKLKFRKLSGCDTPYFSNDSFTNMYKIYFLLLLDAYFENDSQVVSALTVYPIEANFACEDGGKAELEKAINRLAGDVMQLKVEGAFSKFILTDNVCLGVDVVMEIHVPIGLRIMMAGDKSKLVTLDGNALGALSQVSAEKLFKLYGAVKGMFEDESREMGQILTQTEFDCYEKKRIEESLIFYGMDFSNYKDAFLQAKTNDDGFAVCLSMSKEMVFSLIRETKYEHLQDLYLENCDGFDEVDRYVVESLIRFGYLKVDASNEITLVVDYAFWGVETSGPAPTSLEGGDLTGEQLKCIFNLIAPQFYLYEKSDNYIENLTKAVQVSPWVNDASVENTTLSIASYNDFFKEYVSEVLVSDVKTCLLEYADGAERSEYDVRLSLYLLHIVSEVCNNNSYSIAMDLFKSITSEKLDNIKQRGQASLFISNTVDQIIERQRVISGIKNCKVKQLYLDGTVNLDNAYHRYEVFQALVETNSPAHVLEEFCSRDAKRRGVEEARVYDELLTMDIMYEQSICFYLAPETINILSKHWSKNQVVDLLMRKNKPPKLEGTNHNEFSSTIGLQEIHYKEEGALQAYMKDFEFMDLLSVQQLRKLCDVFPDNDYVLQGIFSRPKEKILQFLAIDSSLGYVLEKAVKKKTYKIFKYLLSKDTVCKLTSETVGFLILDSTPGMIGSSTSVLDGLDLEVGKPILNIMFSSELSGHFDLLSFLRQATLVDFSNLIFRKNPSLIINYLLSPDVRHNVEFSKISSFVADFPTFSQFLFQPNIKANGKVPVITFLQDKSFVNFLGRDGCQSLLCKVPNLESEQDISNKVVKGDFVFLKYLLSEEGLSIFGKEWAVSVVKTACNGAKKVLIGYGADRNNSLESEDIFSFSTLLGLLMTSDVIEKDELVFMAKGLSSIFDLNVIDTRKEECLFYKFFLNLDVLKKLDKNLVLSLLNECNQTSIGDYLFSGDGENYRLMTDVLLNKDFVEYVGKDWIRCLIFPQNVIDIVPESIESVGPNTRRNMPKTVSQSLANSLFQEDLHFLTYLLSKDGVSFFGLDYIKSIVKVTGDECQYVLSKNQNISYSQYYDFLLSDELVAIFGVDLVTNYICLAHLNLSNVYRQSDYHHMFTSLLTVARVEQFKKENICTIFNMIDSRHVFDYFLTRNESGIFNLQTAIEDSLLVDAIGTKSLQSLIRFDAKRTENEIRFLGGFIVKGDLDIPKLLLTPTVISFFGKDLISEVIGDICKGRNHLLSGEEDAFFKMLSFLLSEPIIDVLGGDRVTTVFENASFFFKPGTSVVDGYKQLRDNRGKMVTVRYDLEVEDHVKQANWKGYLEFFNEVLSSEKLQILGKTNALKLFDLKYKNDDPVWPLSKSVPFDAFLNLFNLLVSEDVVAVLGGDNVVKLLEKITMFDYVQSPYSDRHMFKIFNILLSSEVVNSFGKDNILSLLKTSDLLVLRDFLFSFPKETCLLQSMLSDLDYRGLVGAEWTQDLFLLFKDEVIDGMSFGMFLFSNGMGIRKLLVNPQITEFIGKPFMSDLIESLFDFCKSMPEKNDEVRAQAFMKGVEFVFSSDVMSLLGVDKVSAIVNNFTFSDIESLSGALSGHTYFFGRLLTDDCVRALGKDRVLLHMQVKDENGVSLWPPKEKRAYNFKNILDKLLTKSTIRELGRTDVDVLLRQVLQSGDGSFMTESNMVLFLENILSDDVMDSLGKYFVSNLIIGLNVSVLKDVVFGKDDSTLKLFLSSEILENLGDTFVFQLLKNLLADCKLDGSQPAQLSSFFRILFELDGIDRIGIENVIGLIEACDSDLLRKSLLTNSYAEENAFLTVINKKQSRELFLYSFGTENLKKLIACLVKASTINATQPLMFKNERSVIMLDILFLPDILKILGLSFVVEKTAQMCKEFIHTKEAIRFSAEYGHRPLEPRPSSTSMVFPLVIETLFSEKVLPLLKDAGSLDPMSSLDLNESKVRKSAEEEPVTDIPIVRILSQFPIPSSDAQLHAIDGNSLLFKKLLNPRIAKILGKETVQTLFELKSRNNVSLWPMTESTERSCIEVFNMFLDPNLVEVLGSDIVVDLLNKSRVKREASASNLDPFSLRSGSFFGEVCAWNPRTFMKILKPDVIKLVGSTHVASWITMQDTDPHKTFFGLMEALSSDARNVDKVALSKTMLYALMNEETILALGVENVQVILQTFAMAMDEHTKNVSDGHYFRSPTFLNLYNGLLDPEIINLLGPDFVYTYVTEQLMVRQPGSTVTAFDWARNHRSGPKLIHTFLAQGTQAAFGQETIVKFLMKDYRNICSSVALQLISQDTKDVVTGQFLEELPQRQGKQRHARLGLTEHWRFKSLPSSLDVSLTFEVGDTLYQLKIDDKFRQQFQGSIPREGVLDEYRQLVLFLGGKNKEIWT